MPHVLMRVNDRVMKLDNDRNLEIARHSMTV